MFEGNSYNIELCHTYDLTISEGLSRTEAAWIQAMCEAESTYFGLLTEGEPAQQARNVLPLALKTELIMTGTVEQWIEFLKLSGFGVDSFLNIALLPVFNTHVLLELIYIVACFRNANC